MNLVNSKGIILSIVRYGTSSFSNRDWVGSFYPKGSKPGDYLTYYAQHFDTVEIDATYYAIPAPETVQSWNDNTPDHFLFAVKLPKSIVHAGENATPNASKILLC